MLLTNGKEDFILAVTNKIEEIFNDSFKVQRSCMVKNNNTKVNCLQVLEDNKAFSAVIYIDDYYDAFLKGKDFDELISDIMQIIASQQTNAAQFKWLTKDFADFNKMKDKIYFKVVSCDKNYKFLEDKPYIRKNDLAIIFGVLEGSYEDRIASITINNNHLELWDVKLIDIVEYAMKNTPKLFPVKFKAMQDILLELMGGVNVMPGLDLESNSENAMYVLTNTNGINGASVIFYKDILNRIAGLLDTDKLVILPSSIHEVILIKYNDCFEPEELREMVASINATEVPAEEILSDRVYIYDREVDDVLILA